MSQTATSFPQPPRSLSLWSLFFATICLLAALLTCRLVWNSATNLNANSPLLLILFAAVVAAVALLFRPAYKSLVLSGAASKAVQGGDAVQARIASAAATESAQLVFGWGVFSLLALGFVTFIFMNDSAVGRTFFLLPLMREKFALVATRFFAVNVFTFVVAEILVLIWGLVVALARLMPGAAGQPIRFLATLYCDVFRGLPGIVTLYLIGFGIPTSGLSDLVAPHIYGWFVDTSAMSAQELRAATRIPVMWWCIMALTLTYGAYVAEVYRAGIESIHWSQVSAARSLGLSYLQTMRHVVVPQAVRRILAPLLNDFIGLQKDTALVQVVGLIDSFSQSKVVASQAFNLSAVTIVAMLFVAVTIPQARLVDHLLEKDAARMKAGGA